METRPSPGPLHAGDRAPDGTGNGVRLFDTFRGPHWTLLTVGPPTTPPPLPLPMTHLPSHKAYGTGVFLVRPDGYVGWAGDTAEGVVEYAGRGGVPWVRTRQPSRRASTESSTRTPTDSGTGTLWPRLKCWGSGYLPSAGSV
ncbi:hypothetical protein QFZ49_002105 [Streptomyces turgidiscabies]|uniref:Uncharacterized protein n=1 Tax=Streptomyces turgidiscabies TaxID=85558 RepID=A0ABU0RMK7_9ACTN|nr:hypothetical protein [Streptomyces turgidiscabies]